MRALDAVGIRHSGREGDVAEWTTQGRRFAHGRVRAERRLTSAQRSARAQEIVTELAARHDIVIVSFHGGGEGEGASKLPFAHEIYAGRGSRQRRGVRAHRHRCRRGSRHRPRPARAAPDRAVSRPAHRLQPRQLRHVLRHQRERHPRHRPACSRRASPTTAASSKRGSTPTVQIRPGGPQPDPSGARLAQLRDLYGRGVPGRRARYR